MWAPRLNGLSGRTSGRARLGPSDSRHALGPLRLDIDGEFHDGEYWGMSLGQAAASVYFDRDRIVTNAAKLGVAGGTVSLFARATRRGDGLVSSLASIEAGPGAIAFASVVVVTMFAAMSFDSRLIWDSQGNNRHSGEKCG